MTDREISAKVLKEEAEKIISELNQIENKHESNEYYIKSLRLVAIMKLVIKDFLTITEDKC